MIEDLTTVVLLVLDRVEREIKLSEEIQSLNVLQCRHLNYVVEGKVEEAERLNVFKVFELLDVILGKVKLLEAWQMVEVTNPLDLVLGQVELFKVQVVEILDHRNVVLAQG